VKSKRKENKRKEKKSCQSSIKKMDEHTPLQPARPAHPVKWPLLSVA
jgi:hypothetical protein